MKQEFEWHEVKECLPEKTGSYFVVRDTGTYAVKRFDGESFPEQYRTVIAWAEIPDASHLSIMTENQRKLMKITDKIKLLEKEKKYLERQIYKERIGETA